MYIAIICGGDVLIYYFLKTALQYYKDKFKPEMLEEVDVVDLSERIFLYLTKNYLIRLILTLLFQSGIDIIALSSYYYFYYYLYYYGNL